MISKEKQLSKLEDERISLRDRSYKFSYLFLLIPLFVAIASMLIIGNVAGIIVLTALSFIVTLILYLTKIQQPFSELKSVFKKSLLDEYMSKYHPSIDYTYQAKKKDVKKIVKKSKLVACNVYKEEDVIQGKFEDISFYLSEIDLRRQSDSSQIKILKGILFRIKMTGRTFPKSRIQSKLGLIKRVFADFKENEAFDFWYETEDQKLFKEELEPLFPFIKHLIKNQKDVRIATENDEIIILMKSDTPFMDDPKLSLGNSFLDEAYPSNMMTQLNTLLHIVESFTLGLDYLELEEQMELKLKEPIRLTHIDKISDSN